MPPRCRAAQRPTSPHRLAHATQPHSTPITPWHVAERYSRRRQRRRADFRPANSASSPPPQHPAPAFNMRPQAIQARSFAAAVGSATLLSNQLAKTVARLRRGAELVSASRAAQTSPSFPSFSLRRGTLPIGREGTAIHMTASLCTALGLIGVARVCWPDPPSSASHARPTARGAGHLACVGRYCSRGRFL